MVFRDLDKQALKQNAYTVLSKITLLNDSSVFTEDDFIVDWTYEDYRYVPDVGFIGQFVERILDGNLQNIPDDKIFENQEVNLQIGIVNGIDNITTWYDYGNFLITDVKKTDTTGNYSFQSADYTKKFNKVFDGDYTDTVYTKSFNQKIEDEETVTALWLAQYVCKQAGVVLYTTNFTNANFIILSNQYDSEDTLRKVMQDIGKLAYSWVRIAEDNKVHIDFTPKETSSVDQYDQLTTDEYYISKKSDLTFGPVNKVLIGMSSVEGENMYETSEDYTEETECAIKIYDNNLTNTEELRALALNGCERLFGIEYTPMEIETIGHPWLEGDELIKLTNVDNEILYTYPFNRKITYAGYIKGVIGAEATTTQDSEYEYKSDVINSVKKTTIIVDKQNQTITGLVEDVGENTSNITTLQESVGGISATVEALDNNVQDITDQVNSVLQAENTVKGNPVNIEDGGEYLIKNISFYGNLEQETEEEEAGTTIDIVGSATLTDVDTTKESRVLSLKGQTSQTTYSGKNLLDLTSFTTTTQSGITLTPTFNGNELLYITSSGTFSSTTYILLTNTLTIQPSTSYTLSGGYNASSRLRLREYDSSNTQLSEYFDQGSGVTFTSKSNVHHVNIQVVFYAQNNVKFYPMLRLSSVSDATYEPYVGGTTSPNPQYPQPVNVVSGDNYIDICGKNLFDKNGTPYRSNYYINGSGTQTANNDFKIYKVQLTPGAKYVITNDGTSYTPGFSYYDKNGNYINGLSYSSNSTIPITAPSNVSYMLYSVKNSNADTYQLEKGSTASTYEPYIGNSYPIYLGVENLLPTNEYIASTTINGITYTNNGDGTFSLSGTATANTAIRIIPFDVIDIQPNQAYYLYSSKDYEANTFNVAIIGSDNGTTKYLYPNNTNTFTTTPTNLRLQFYIASGKSVSATNVKMYLIKGTKLNHLSTTPIELCKIGTYQDKIYKENGSWYLHKEIGKVVLDGNTTLTSYTTNVSGHYRYGVNINDIKKTSSATELPSIYCTHYVGQITGTAGSWGAHQGISIDNSNTRIYINDDTYYSQSTSAYSTWLSSNNVPVYYVLATPTTTLITNTTLLEQLDDLESQ